MALRTIDQNKDNGWTDRKSQLTKEMLMTGIDEPVCIVVMNIFSIIN
jgi:hypothetical protein